MASPDVDPVPVLAYAPDNAAERLRRQCASFWIVARASAVVAILAAWVSLVGLLISLDADTRVSIVVWFAAAIQCLGVLTFLVTSKLAIPQAQRVQRAIVTAVVVFYVAGVAVVAGLMVASAVLDWVGFAIVVSVVAILITIVMGRAALRPVAPEHREVLSEEPVTLSGRHPDV